MEIKERIEASNAEALERLSQADMRWVGVERVINAVPGIHPNTILHSGPPIEWERMLPVHQNGIVGAVLHEKLASSPEEAKGMIEAGEIEIGSANDYYCVGAGAGIISPSMVVNVGEDRKTGLKGWCIPFEGRSGLGVWGVYNEEVERNLRDIEERFAPAMDHVLKAVGGMDIKSILVRGLQMGDECHTRQTACGLLLVGEAVPLLLDSDLSQEEIAHVVRTLVSSERWFHPLAMCTGMAAARGIKGLPYCTVVTSIASNGVETGIKVADSGERWFLAPSPRLTGQYFSTQWGPDDAVPYMGDSTVTEVVGMGGLAAAAAPAVLRLRGGGYREAIAQSMEMREICVGVNRNFPLPLLDFTGPGLGIDIRKVVESGITPLLHGGIISRDGGQIGAGAARFPGEHYEAALYAFLEKYGLL